MSAAAAMHAISPERRKSCWLGTPEIYFRKTIDNSRLVKVADVKRRREMAQFAIALVVFGWGWFVRGEDARVSGPGTELLLLAPFLLGQILSWFFFYDADRAAHVATYRTVDSSLFAPGLAGSR